jgi:hypothetical protein
MPAFYRLHVGDNHGGTTDAVGLSDSPGRVTVGCHVGEGAGAVGAVGAGEEVDDAVRDGGTEDGLAGGHGQDRANDLGSVGAFE